MVTESRDIRLVAILSICYEFAINLAQGPWKSEAAKMYQTLPDVWLLLVII